MAQTSIEAAIRYPVDLPHAGEIDNKLTHEIFEAIDREPKLNLAGISGSGMKLRTDISRPETP